MYEGWPVNIDTLVDTKFAGKRTPVSIINIAHLDFIDQAYVVGYIAYLIWFWMRRLSGTYEPRLIFYIDEIGGGGGKTAFFPSVASSPCKPALNLLLRQGRAQGVCCIFATQNPGDIDYKGLSNCGTWMVGRLKTNRDRSKIKQGASDADIEFESVQKYIPSLNTGQFIVKTPSKPWSIVQERWLMSLHRPLAAQELKKLKARYENNAKIAIEQVENLYANEYLKKALTLVRDIITKFPFSVLAARAFILLARILMKQGKYHEARCELQKLLKRWITDTELAEVRFLIGSCHEREGNYTSAAEAFREAEKRLEDKSIKEEARIHYEYCEARSTWATLGPGGKFIWWITGKKPDEGQVFSLQVKDDQLLTEIHQTKLRELDFFLPPEIDYSVLAKAETSIIAAAEADNVEKVKLLYWAEEQADHVTSLLVKGDLPSAVRIGEQIVQKLSAHGLSASEKIIAVLKQLSGKRETRSRDIRSKFSSLEPREFEFEIARLLRLMGFKADVTKATGDDGVDVFAHNGNEKIIVQCKRWESKPVNRAVVDELAGAAKRYEATRAILATTSYFSPEAMKTAMSHEIVLWDFPTICSKFHEYRIKPT